MMFFGFPVSKTTQIILAFGLAPCLFAIAVRIVYRTAAQSNSPVGVT